MTDKKFNPEAHGASKLACGKKTLAHNFIFVFEDLYCELIIYLHGFHHFKIFGQIHKKTLIDWELQIFSNFLGCLVIKSFIKLWPVKCDRTVSQMKFPLTVS